MVKFTKEEIAKYSKDILINITADDSAKIEKLSCAAIARINDRAKIWIDIHKKEQIQSIINSINFISR